MVWRLGIVPYLNADPLAAALREPEAAFLVGDAVEVLAMVPSRLLTELLDGGLDAALVSTAGVLPYPELRILPDMCVSSRGPVRSIQLYSCGPVGEARTVALDSSSRSAVALARVLFAERWRAEPEFLTRPPDLAAMLKEADAALLIGNPALQANQALDQGRWEGHVPHRVDLGAEWETLTGLPFVYAVWAAAEMPGRDLNRLTRLLLRAKAWGVRRLGLLAARGAETLGLPLSVTSDYLTRAIRYELGPDERAGMERFREMAVRHGVLPRISAARFVESTPLAAGYASIPTLQQQL